MSDTTTIQITKAQKAELDNVGGDSYKAALQLLIEHYNDNVSVSDGVDETQVRRIAQEEINDMVTGQALL